jgi:hypothetical protein
MPKINVDQQLIRFNKHKAQTGFTFNVLQAVFYLYILEDLLGERRDNGRVLISFPLMQERTHIGSDELRDTLNYYLKCKLISQLVIVGEEGKQNGLFKINYFK